MNRRNPMKNEDTHSNYDRQQIIKSILDRELGILGTHPKDLEHTWKENEET